MTLSSGRRCQSGRVDTACLVAALTAGGACAVEPPVARTAPTAPEADAEQAVPLAPASPIFPISPGSHVTIRDATGREWCATVVYLLEGPGSDMWAWVRLNADPRRTDRAPLRELRPGCSPA